MSSEDVEIKDKPNSANTSKDEQIVKQIPNIKSPKSKKLKGSQSSDDEERKGRSHSKGFMPISHKAVLAREAKKRLSDKKRLEEKLSADRINERSSHNSQSDKLSQDLNNSDIKSDNSSN
jgi:hypothetical protein